MQKTKNPKIKKYLFSGIVLLSLSSASAWSETLFTEALIRFPGWVWVEPDEGNKAIYPGQAAVISGADLVPGQKLTLMPGPTVLNLGEQILVGEDGEFSFTLSIDEDAAPGLQPIVVIAENPATAKVIDLKISSELPTGGVDQFDIASKKVDGGQYLYQVAYSKSEDALFVTSSVGRPPIRKSALLKLDPVTFETIASVAPAGPAPVNEYGYETGLYAVYGIGVDDSNGHVWTTNTRQNTVAVYSTRDLSLVRQFDPGVVPHGRDVVVDEARGRVYVSATGTNEIRFFDSATLEQLEPIRIETKADEGQFSPMALDLDSKSGKLFTVSIDTPEAAVIDLDSGDTKILNLEGMKAAWGIAYDPQEGLLFTVSNSTDNLLILDAEGGKVLHEVILDAGPLSVTFEPESRLAFIASRNAGRITVVDTMGVIVANLEAGILTNQLRADSRGNVYAVNQSFDETDPQGDQVWRLRAKGLAGEGDK